MKVPSYLLSRASFFLIVILFGCESEIENNEVKASKKNRPNLNGILNARKPSNARVSWYRQVLAFNGNDLYRIHSDSQEVEYIGSDWSGTEAATIHNGNLYAVQGGHLWKCELSAGTCVDLGVDWTGTSFLTNDGTHLYAIQGGRLWRINSSTGNWFQLGNGDWTGTTEMGFSYTISSGGALFIQQSNRLWKVSKINGSWVDFSSQFDNVTGFYRPFVIPYPYASTSSTSSKNCATCLIGVAAGYSGNLLSIDLAKPFLVDAWGKAITFETSDVALTPWFGASDITFTRITGAFIDIYNVYVLKDFQIHRYTKTTSNLVPYDYQGTVSGLNSTYIIVSSQGL